MTLPDIDRGISKGTSKQRYRYLKATDFVPVIITDSNSPYTPRGEHVLFCDTTDGAITVNLVRISSARKDGIWIKNIGEATNDVTVDGWQDEKIDADATWTLTDLDVIYIIPANSKWNIISTGTGYML